jgi:large subunit ribosomal protein L15
MRLGNLRGARGSRRVGKRLGLGPGSGTGKTAGKGHKGQRARSGGRRGSRTGFEGGQMPLHRRIPKIGFSNHPFRKRFEIVNLADIESRALAGDIGPEELKQAGLIRRSDSAVKILGDGELSRKVSVQAHAFSQSAVLKIEQAGGKVDRIRATAARAVNG